MRKILGVALLATSLAVGVAGAPADAGRSTTVIDSPNDAHRGIDMHRVTIEKRLGALQIRTRFSHMGRNLNGVQYYFDTKRAHPGPEFGAVFYRDKDGDGLTAVHVYRMQGWRKVVQERICSTHNKWRINPNGTGVFSARFGLGCFELPRARGWSVPLFVRGTTRSTAGSARCADRCSDTTTRCGPGVRSRRGSEHAPSPSSVHLTDTTLAPVMAGSPFGSPSPRARASPL